MRGFVHLKRFLSPAQQLQLTRWAERCPLSEHAFRRRYYGPIVEPFQAWADMALAAAQDPLLKPVNYTHLILLKYVAVQPPPDYYIPWHTDNGDNDGNADYPIVSFSVGASCTLLVSPGKPRIVRGQLQAQAVECESGDALIWGGPARGLWHAVKDLRNSLFGRYNLTLRYSPQLIGHIDMFTHIPDGLEKQNRFYRL